MKLFLPALLAAASLCALPGSPLRTLDAHAVDAEAVDRCHQAILRGLAAVSRGRIALVGRCLKDGKFDSCGETDFHVIPHENELRNFLAGPASDCRTAIASGAALADFGPTTCDSDWADCSAAVPAIATLEDMAECLVCQQKGFDFRMRADFGMPRPLPSDADERRCNCGIARLVTNTVRKAVFDTMACASGGSKPFACAVDATSGSRFGAALATFGKAIDRCGLDQGRAPGILASLCSGTETNAAGLTTCLAGLARCIACRTANSGLGQSADCVAFSGVPDCDGTS